MISILGKIIRRDRMEKNTTGLLPDFLDSLTPSVDIAMLKDLIAVAPTGTTAMDGLGAATVFREPAAASAADDPGTANRS